MKFTKMQGTGNDFVMIDNIEGTLHLTPDEIAGLCDRHFGIGADGLILVESSATQEVFMNYYNRDGSTAEICGNGVRCLAKYVVDQGIAAHNGPIAVETRAGKIVVEVESGGGAVSQVRVDMGKVDFKAEHIPVIAKTQEVLGEQISCGGVCYTYGCASMGNPHMTVLVEDMSQCPLEKLGAYFENHEMFPEKCNISFAQVIDGGHIRMDTWERGAGQTLACGTGTCSAVAVLGRFGLVEDVVEATLSGGRLTIAVKDGRVTMSGPATTVFTGEIEIRKLGESL
ncbi:diaminopimelate epimerase [Eubacterium aggregans]|uniref:diaminopimelate epimerase n=1 Tax=Eubacterium aggregans TaxID=81409 RepID=UPI003F2C4363